MSAVAGVGRPAELDSWQVYLAVEAALHAGSPLRSMDDDLLGDRTTPSPITASRIGTRITSMPL